MSIRNSKDKNSIFKNENLKNMLNKLSEEAKKQFSHSNASHKLNELLNTKFFIEEENQKNKSTREIKFNLENEPNNENFTNEFYMERYKNYIPSNIITPADFNANFCKDNNIWMPVSGKKHLSDNISNNNSNQINFTFFDIIFDKIKSDLVVSKLSRFKIENWIKCYNELNGNLKNNVINLRHFLQSLNRSEKTNFSDSILYQLESFFSRYSINSGKEIIICEISDVKFMDNLQIISITDFSFNQKDIVIVEEKSEGIDLNSTVRDDYFDIHQIILLKSNYMKVLNPSIPRVSIISINNIKKLD